MISFHKGIPHVRLHTEPYGSEQTAPRKAHQTTIFSWKGFRMTPSNLSESIC
jgi:hypothetical protein